MPADRQDAASAPAMQGRGLPHPHPVHAPADPASAVLAAGGRTPERDEPDLDDPFGAEPDELDGCTEGEPGPVRAVRAAFALGHPADGMSPGAVLASLSEQAWQHGLADLDEDQLTGMLQAADRLAACRAVAADRRSAR